MSNVIIFCKLYNYNILRCIPHDDVCFLSVEKFSNPLVHLWVGDVPTILDNHSWEAGYGWYECQGTWCQNKQNNGVTIIHRLYKHRISYSGKFMTIIFLVVDQFVSVSYLIFEDDIDDQYCVQPPVCCSGREGLGIYIVYTRRRIRRIYYIDLFGNLEFKNKYKQN